jgi:hypothetical protein
MDSAERLQSLLSDQLSRSLRLSGLRHRGWIRMDLCGRRAPRLLQLHLCKCRSTRSRAQCRPGRAVRWLRSPTTSLPCNSRSSRCPGRTTRGPSLRNGSAHDRRPPNPARLHRGRHVRRHTLVALLQLVQWLWLAWRTLGARRTWSARSCHSVRIRRCRTRRATHWIPVHLCSDRVVQAASGALGAQAG